MGLILPFVPRCVFDDVATRVMGEAFDAACEELGDMGRPHLVREGMAKRIIEVARAGERDVRRLREAALAGLKGQEAELTIATALLIGHALPGIERSGVSATSTRTHSTTQTSNCHDCG
jgi:hypothetical protein